MFDTYFDTAMEISPHRHPNTAPADPAEHSASRGEPARRGAWRQRAASAAQAAQAARDWLLAAQADDGHWCGELEGDTILETEFVLLLHFLGRLDDPRVGKAARYVRQKQQTAGGWAIYPGGPPEVSASVKAYLVLKMAGDDPEAPHMQRARRTILALGGIEACNSFTKMYLSICGQYDWKRCPAVPPEMVLLPRWLYFNLYEISSWSRGIVVPLSIVWALQPVRPVARQHAVDELRLPASGPLPATPATARHKVLGGASRRWRGAFLVLDGVLRIGERLHLHPFRRLALARAEAWVLERLEDSDGLGAIFPPIVNTILALCCLGHDPDGPLVRGQIRELERLEIEEDGALRLQPCFSAVWDTALALHALGDSTANPAHLAHAANTANPANLADTAAPAHPAILAARRWLFDREVRRHGDWSVKAPAAQPSGWCFEYRNAFYPDCDDTAEVLTALAATSGGRGFGGSGNVSGSAADEDAAVRRGIAWLLAMQNDDGGWGAFDRGCDKEVLTHVPFADHNALLDPSTADVTGRAVDTLCRLGFDATTPPVARAVAFLRAQQEPDGTWYGRWGCNYIYGTWLVLQALAHCGGDTGSIADEPWCRRAAAWLLDHQNPDGGWGETPLSYDDPAQKGIGPSTAAQTAWALMALFAAGAATPASSPSLSAPPSTTSPAIDRGVDYLLRTQRADGSWRDEPWTATGFPRVFYLRYHYYAVYFPLMALSGYARLREAGAPHPTQHLVPLAAPLRAAAVEGAVR